MDVIFHLPGLRFNYPLNMLMLSFLESQPEYFREGVKIGSFFGEFPTSAWAGGRDVFGDQCDTGFIRNVIKTINSHNIPIRYTYTNPILEPDELDDFYCNFCMQEADNGMNQVLVVSPILEEYIRKTYPSFKICSSTCKEIRTIEGLNEELKKDYHLVVLDYNLNNEWDQLAGVSDPSRCEVLVNACCVPNCPRRGAHYENVAKNHRIEIANRDLPPEKKIPIIPWECKYGEYNCIYTIQDYKTYVSPEAIYKEYLPRGFNNFKIEGRTGNLYSLVETYCHYLIKPEFQGYVRIELYNNLEANRIIVKNKPRPGVWP